MLLFGSFLGYFSLTQSLPCRQDGNALLHRQADRSEHPPLDFPHQLLGEGAPQCLLTDEMLRKGRDLFTLQHRLPWNATIPFLQRNVGWRRTEYRGGWDDQDITRELVASVQGNDQRWPFLLRRLAGDPDPVQTAPLWKGAHFQLFSTWRLLSWAHSSSSIRSCSSRSR